MNNVCLCRELGFIFTFQSEREKKMKKTRNLKKTELIEAEDQICTKIDFKKDF